MEDNTVYFSVLWTGFYGFDFEGKNNKKKYTTCLKLTVKTKSTDMFLQTR